MSIDRIGVKSFVDNSLRLDIGCTVTRPLRIQFGGAVYHVMNRGTARQATFVDEQDNQAFLSTLGEARRLWAIEVFSYCLMKNHYHVCLSTPKGNLSRVMRHVDGLYTQRFNGKGTMSCNPTTYFDRSICLSRRLTVA